MSIYISVFLIGVLVSSAAQIRLKKSALIQHNSIIKEYLNLRVIGAYGIFVCATLCTMYAYKGIPLSMGPILSSTEYIFVAMLAYFFLKEKISRRKIFGLAIIVVGVIIYSL